MTVNEMIGKTAIISPAATLEEAADKMAATDSAVLSVMHGRDVVGIITDRDIIVSAISRGKNPAREKVRDHMSSRVQVCDGNAHDMQNVSFADAGAAGK